MIAWHGGIRWVDVMEEAGEMLEQVRAINFNTGKYSGLATLPPKAIQIEDDRGFE